MTHVRSHTLKRADQLTEKDMGHKVRIGEVEGELTGLLPIADRVELVLIVGGTRAFFPLAHDADVDVWGKPRGDTK